MGKFIALVKNEVIKSTRKASFIILTVILALATIFVAVGPYIGTLLINNYVYDYDEDYYMKDSNIDEFEIELRKNMQKNNSYDNFYNKYGTLLENDDKNLYFDYNSLKAAVYCFEAIKKGTHIKSAETAFRNYIGDDLSKYTNGNSYDQIDKILEIIKPKLQEKLNIIENEDIGNLVALNKSLADEELAKYQLKLSEYQSQNSSQSDIALVKEKVDIKRQRADVYNYMAQNLDKIKSDYWRTATLSLIINILNTIDDLTNQYYNVNPRYIENYSSPEEFKKITKKQIDDYKNRTKAAWYALNNEIKLLGIENNYSEIETVGNNDTRSVALNGVSTAVSFICLICIILGGVIVSNEYSKGTIRLLLLRPISRVKTIASKIVAVVFIGVVLGILSILLFTVISGLIYGWSDYLQPIVIGIGGKAIKINFFVYLLLAFFTALLNIIFISSLAIFMSTLFKNSALAVGLTIFYNLTTSIVVAIAIELKQVWIKYTPFPYSDFSQFYINKAYISEYNGLMDISAYLSIVQSLPAGIICLTVLSVLLIFFSILIFKKRDVK